MTYEQYLRQIAAQGGLEGREAQALLNAGITNDAGRLKNAGANVLTNTLGGLTGDYSYANFLGYNDRGHIESGGYGYGAQGLNALDQKYSSQFQQIGSGGDTGGGYVGGGYVAPQPVDPDAALRTQLRNEISARGGDIDALYNSLFSSLDSLVKTRGNELETQYGDQLRKAGDQYAAALPQIEGSYAAIGAADSTDLSDSNDQAKAGFEETTETIGKNKEADQAKLGAYRTENRAKITEDRGSAKRNVSRAADTEDVGALRSMRNDLESNLSNARVTRSTFGTDGKARQELSNLTKDAGRYEAAVNALDSILKGSMSGSVKEAAVKAVVDSAGLSDEEKKKVQQQYGNVYAEQAAL